MKKTLVVTGGSKGIGRAIVEVFAEKGFDICTTSRNQTELQQLQENLKERFPTIQTHVLASDQSKKEEVARFATFCLERCQSIDVVVANTGVYIPGQVHSEADGTLEKMIETNLYSAYYLIKSLVKTMMTARKGHIFTVCSTASITPYINGGAYCVSKYALLGFTKVLREEMKEHQVKVTAILPGATRTASWDGTDLPDDRFMTSEDIARCILGAYQLSKSAVVEELLIRPQLGDIA